MQMTNICRDILEDAERARVYLPADMLEGHVAPPALLLRPVQRVNAYNGAAHLLGIADEY